MRSKYLTMDEDEFCSSSSSSTKPTFGTPTARAMANLPLWDTGALSCMNASQGSSERPTFATSMSVSMSMSRSRSRSMSIW